MTAILTARTLTSALFLPPDANLLHVAEEIKAQSPAISSVFEIGCAGQVMLNDIYVSFGCASVSLAALKVY